MQNAKNLPWSLKGELTEVEKEPALPTGNDLNPSPQHLPPADLPLHLRTETISSASSGCPAFSMLSALLGEGFPGFGSSAEQPLGLVVLEEGQGARTRWTEMWSVAAGTVSPLPAQPAAFLLPRAVSLGCGWTLDLPQGLSRGGLNLFFWLCLLGRSGWAWLNPSGEEGNKSQHLNPGPELCQILLWAQDLCRALGGHWDLFSSQPHLWNLCRALGANPPLWRSQGSVFSSQNFPLDVTGISFSRGHRAFVFQPNLPKAQMLVLLHPPKLPRGGEDVNKL